jgi:hypothetical protein
VAFVGIRDLNAVHLLQPTRFRGQSQSMAQSASVLRYPFRFIADMGSEIQTFARGQADTAGASGHCHSDPWHQQGRRL